MSLPDDGDWIMIAADHCPSRKHRPSQSRQKADLRKELAGNSLRFYCAECDQFWEPSENEKEHLRKLVGLGD